MAVGIRRALLLHDNLCDELLLLRIMGKHEWAALAKHAMQLWAEWPNGAEVGPGHANGAMCS